MKEIILKLTEMSDNIKYDIECDWTDAKEKANMTRQAATIDMAIGLLDNIGENNNIGN